MDLHIAIPQIDPFENGYTLIFRPGVNLITGLNGSGKSRVAKEILKKALEQNTTALNTNLILLDEFFFDDITPEFLQDSEIFPDSDSQKRVCDAINSIYKDIAKPAFFEKVIFKNNCFTQDRLGGASERAILNLITLVAYRSTKEKYQEIPLIIDGILGILNRADLEIAIKIIKHYVKYSILLTYPQSLSYLNFLDIVSHHKIIAKISKELFQNDFEGHAEPTEINSLDYSCRIELA